MELVSLAQLERSHRRHDEVMAGLLEAARRLAAGRPDAADLERVREAVAYFERAVARHFLDEEGSVFPRLSTRRPELAVELAALSAEHPHQIALQGLVAAAALTLDDTSRQGAGKELLDAAMRLAEAHTTHVGREDALFRIAQDALTAEDDADIVAEMEMRRDRDSADGRTGRGGGGGGGGGGGRGRGRGGGGGGGGGGGRRNQDTEASGSASPQDPTLDLRPVGKAKATPTTRSSKRATAKPKPKAAAKTAKKAAKTPAKKPVKKPAKTAAKKPPTKPAKASKKR